MSRPRSDAQSAPGSGAASAPDPLAGLADLPGVPQAVERSRAAVDAVRAHPVLRRRGPEVAAESALRGARASAALEGCHVPLGTLRAAVTSGVAGAAGGSGGSDRLEVDAGNALGSGDPAGAGDDALHPLVLGAVRVCAELGALVGTWKRAPLQVLARLHVLAASDLLEPARLGRPRGAGEQVEDPHGLGPAPSADEAAHRLDQLARLLVAPSTAPALVVAAVVHGEVLALRPFAGADGLVARAGARITLVARGLDPQSVTVPEAGHLALGRDAYGEALRAYVGGGPQGMARWVVHCGEAVTRGAREAAVFCDAMQSGRRDP